MPWKTGGTNPAYGRSAWRRARAECLRRAGYRCEARLPGCVGTASEADHVFGIDADPQHRSLRAVCSPCHKQITSQQSSRGHREPPATANTEW